MGVVSNHMAYVMDANLQQAWEFWSKEANRVNRVRWGNWTNSLCSVVEEDLQPETGKRRGKEGKS